MTDSLDKETILAANQAFYDAFSNKDIKSMRLLWWQGSTSLCIHPGGRILIGWESIQASWESIFKNTDSMEIDIEIIKVEIDREGWRGSLAIPNRGVDPAFAYVVVREMVLQSSRGRKVKAPSMATNIFQNMAQKWYLVHHHGSPIMR